MQYFHKSGFKTLPIQKHYLYLHIRKNAIMKSTEINKEIVRAKNIMDKLMVCIKEGKTELY